MPGIRPKSINQTKSPGTCPGFPKISISKENLQKNKENSKKLGQTDER